MKTNLRDLPKIFAEKSKTKPSGYLNIYEDSEYAMLKSNHEKGEEQERKEWRHDGNVSDFKEAKPEKTAMPLRLHDDYIKKR